MNPTKKQINKICEKLKVNFVSSNFLGRGSHNENFVINTKQDKFVLRIENNHQFKNLKKEYSFLKKTNGKLGPKVFLFDNSKKIIKNDFLIEEFIEGKHPTKIDNKFIKTMALWYKKLHRTKKKANAPDLSKLNCIKRYRRSKHILDTKTTIKLDNLYKECIKQTKTNQNKYFKDKSLSLTHGDPSRQNIFYEKDNVKLIDWEFVEYYLSEADLVFFIWSYNLNKKQKNLFLKTYNYKKSNQRLNLMLLTHILSMIAWRVERLCLIKRGKIKRNMGCSTKKEVCEENKKDINLIKEILKKLK